MDWSKEAIDDAYAMQWIADIPFKSQPFNAFLSGFSATVGQFVLTASLRMQTNPENKTEFGSISHERYVLRRSHNMPDRERRNSSELTRTFPTGHLRTFSSAA